MNKYYCLVAGLPDLSLDDTKLAYSLGELKKLLKEELKESDFRWIELFFGKFDNINLLRYLKDADDVEMHPLGNLRYEQIAAIVGHHKGNDIPKMPAQPEWFSRFVPAFLEEKPLYPNMSWEDQLTSLYYETGMKCGNEFIRSWFEFNLDVNNILAAISCRAFGFSVAESIVGDTELAKTLRTTTAKDFGLAHNFPHLEDVYRISDEANLMEREKKTDMLKWRWLEENSFFSYFSIENIFTYLIQTGIIERWLDLNEETGHNRFRGIVSRLKRSFEFQEEYQLKK